MAIKITWYKWRGNNRYKDHAFFIDKAGAEKFIEGLDEGEDITFEEVTLSEVK